MGMKMITNGGRTGHAADIFTVFDHCVAFS
jgi:hypothetical protein